MIATIADAPGATLTTNELRTEVGRTFGFHCSICTEKGRLLMSRIDKRKPPTLSNTMLLCEPCADFRDHGVRP